MSCAEANPSVDIHPLCVDNGLPSCLPTTTKCLKYLANCILIFQALSLRNQEISSVPKSVNNA